jgi:hypothetical protein
MLISLFISAIIALGRSIAYCASAGDENERIRLLSSLLTDRQKIDTIIEDLEFNEEKTTQDLIDLKNNTVAMCKTLVHSTLPRIIETAARQDGSNEE